MTASEVLRKARALIEKPESWAQGAYARDAQKIEVPSRSPKACAWCVMGAIQVSAPESYSARQRAYEALREVGNCEYVGDFNDLGSHEEVVVLVDRAIAAAEARGE